ncbi:MOSC domain-containing protein [Reichenbachiella sp. MSK19-1]|uniref:MOSC domain-containing protein n=1 Tax=Reichenbachiella sp. MSK19-1 TaxID=1897631 RepID=UPI000E6BD875|nr:MOSC domain-containing protein [Reichenbachiella sp. MSK19-1]RJE72900.1 sulfurase [Reichenbachiella sp. MSK19-1]
MEIVSTNIATSRTIVWNGKEEQTGIYKEPTDQPLYLGKADVKGDAVIDRKHHGGVDKACYLYSADHYPFWREKYPNLDLPYGMFGENLTVAGLDETKMIVGDVYQLGEAKVQVSEPRQPCYKLGVRFGDQGVLKEFIAAKYAGVYLRIIDEGQVQKGDQFVLLEAVKGGLSIADVFDLTYGQYAEPELLRTLLSDEYLPSKLREKLIKKHSK